MAVCRCPEGEVEAADELKNLPRTAESFPPPPCPMLPVPCFLVLPRVYEVPTHHSATLPASEEQAIRHFGGGGKRD